MAAQHNRGMVKFIILVIVFVLLALLIPMVLSVRKTMYYRERAEYAQAKLESMKPRCPGNVPTHKWDRAVDWTSNAIAQIYFSPTHGDIQSLENLCTFLDEQSRGEVNLKTLRETWEQYENAVGRGKKYATSFRDVRLLADEPITDGNLADLWSLDKCLTLDLSDTEVTDAGMKHLVNGSFGLLMLSGTKVGDDGVRELMSIKSLDGLHLGKTDVTDEGVKHLLAKPTIDSLSLNSTSITDAALEDVGKLARLRTLWLSETQVTDAGLQHLTGLHEMTQLDLSKTPVTMEGIMQLKDLNSLRMLILKGTRVPESGKAEIEQSFRSCTVRF